MTDAADRTMVIANCTIRTNSSYEYGGGIYYYDTGATSAHGLTVSNCLVIGNGTRRNSTAGSGAGLAFFGFKSLTLVDSSFTDNACTNGGTSANGGGVWIIRGSPNIRRCTFARNEADDRGGGVYMDTGVASPPAVDFTISASDFYANSARTSGGLYVERDNHSGDDSIDSCRFL